MQKLKNWILKLWKKRLIRRPETDRTWTTIYYGARGSGKTLHQSKETLNILKYLVRLYDKHPSLHKAIVFTNSKLSANVENEFGEYIYYWEDCDDFKNCPRKNCWKGKHKHRIHGAYLIFDDLANILPSGNWQQTPMWLKKIFLQGRHFGIRCLANVQDPFSIDINFRRCVDLAYKFSKIFGNPDPDETKPAIKHIFGIYRRRKIDAETLWRYGDLPEQTIRLILTQKEEQNKQLKEMGKELEIVYDDSWRGSYHLFNKSGKFLGFNIASTEIYDTCQDIPEYEPKGFMHKEFQCIDPNCNHTDPKAENYCKHKKIIHELI
jgi:hypothetical protein